MDTQPNATTRPDLSTPEARQRQLERLVLRLSDGEDLEAVRAEFVRDFASVGAEEIAQAEQQLISNGMPVPEVQRLCDVHSALFHGRTDDEVREADDAQGDLPAGHPVSALKRENVALCALLDGLEPQLASGVTAAALSDELVRLKELKRHYGKKEELLMPLLAERGLTGPSEVMWGVDDEILHECSALARQVRQASDDDLPERLERTRALLARMREMVFKEERIFLPLCLEHLSREQWYAVYRDLDEFGWAFGCEPVSWPDAEAWIGEQAQEASAEGLSADGTIRLPTGELTVRQLEAILRLLPVDLTFIDEQETTRFFTNEGKVFARPLSCLGRDVWSCHPPKIIPMVKAMIEDFKARRRDHMEVWTPNPKNPVRVLYLAVYGDDDAYLGTLEIVQQFGSVLEHLSGAPAAQ